MKVRALKRCENCRVNQKRGRVWVVCSKIPTTNKDKLKLCTNNYYEI